MVKQAESVADWETAMARSSQQSWKDEWLTILRNNGINPDED